MVIRAVLRSLRGATERTDLRFTHLHHSTPTGGLTVVTYLSGDRLDSPRVIASTATVTLPDNTVLVEREGTRRYTEISGEQYPIVEYTTHDETEFDGDGSVTPLPAALRGRTIQRRDLSATDLDDFVAGL